MGGALSLYLGISIAMFFEILQFLVDVILDVSKYFATMHGMIFKKG